MRNGHRTLIAVIAVLALGSIAAGCGDDDEGTTTTQTTTAEEGTESGGATVPVSMGEWFIKPYADTVSAGKVTFDVTNDGDVEHEFVVLKTDIAGADLPVKSGEVELSKAGEVVGGAHEPGEEEEEMDGAAEEHEEEEHLEPGAGAGYTIDAMKPGSYVLICNIAGHYSNGQWAELTVK